MSRLLPIAAACALLLSPYALSGGEEKGGTLSTVVVDTGQDRCFNNGAEIPYPKPGGTYFGQDAQYSTRAPSHRDNGDGTITDLNTRLTWQKRPDFVKRTQDEAERYSESLVLGGRSDWRLPTIKELFSIADFRGNMRTRTPYIDTTVFDFEYPEATQGESGRPGQRDMDAQYCSSTRYLGITMGRDRSAFGFNFADGRIKSYPLNAERYVRCVRGARDYGVNRLVDNRDGTITDRATGLTWQKADSVSPMDWKQALAYAESLKLAGRDDWRLPNVKELQSIVDYERAPDATDRKRRGPAIDPVFMLTEDESWFWTGTTHIENQFAYYVCFGQAFSTRMSAGKQINAHGAGAVRSDPKEGDPGRWPNGLGPQADEIRVRNYVRCVRGGAVTLLREGPEVKRDARNPPPPGDGGRGGGRFIRRLDKDGDGKVSRSEFDGPPRRFGRIDKNGDGFIDAKEAPSGPPGGGRRGPGREGGPRRTTESVLQVITVGTGSPLENPERSSPSALIRYGRSHVLVDMGEGTASQLANASIPLKSVAAFCFTHHHRDHNADAMTLLPKAWLKGTGAPIIGPKGTQALTSFLWDFFEEDLSYRLGNRSGSKKKPAAPKAIELPRKEPLTIAGLRITTAEVSHSMKTFAYRFDAEGQSIVISGDLSYSKGLIELAAGADILVMDSGGIVYEGSETKDPDRRGRGGRTPAHATLEEIARMAAGAKVTHLVLTHFRPGEIDEQETRRRMRPIFSGEIHFANDMQTFRAR